MNRLLSFAVMSLFVLGGCSSTVDDSYDPASDTNTASEALVPNAYWELDMGAQGMVVGDYASLETFSNGTATPTGIRVILRSTTNAGVAGSFMTTTYQPAGFYSTGIRGFNVAGGPNVLVGTPTSAVNVANTSLVSLTDGQIDFQGDSLFLINPGEETQTMGDFTFLLKLNGPGSIPTDQIPLPFDTTDDTPDDISCPAWTFEELDIGELKTDGWYAERDPATDLITLSGDEVISAWTGTQFVIRFDSNFMSPEEYGGRIILDQIPTQGLTADYPAYVLYAAENDDRHWGSPNATFSVKYWSEGVMYGEISGTANMFDSTQSGTPMNPYPPRIEDDIPVDFKILAPLPQYNDAYDDLCQELEDEESNSIFTLTNAAKVAEAACLAKYIHDQWLCHKDAKKDPAQPPERYRNCRYRAKVAAAVCMQAAGLLGILAGN